jgi:Tol biopolymer transport system component
VPRKVRDDARAEAISPDGRVALTRNHPGSNRTDHPAFSAEEIWLTGPNGEQAQRFLTAQDSHHTFDVVRWSPDGRMLAYENIHQLDNKIDQSIQVTDLSTKSTTTVLSNPQLGEFLWLPEGRILYSVTDIDGKSQNLWAMNVSKKGIPKSEPNQLTSWAGFFVGALSATADGKQLTFVRTSFSSSVFVAEFDRSGPSLKAPRRLTFADAIELPFDWTADGTSVVFASNRNGHWGVFKQRLDQDSAETVVSGIEGAEAISPRVSPDGRWVVYSEVESLDFIFQSLGSSPMRIMRVTVTGGSPELIFSA